MMFKNLIEFIKSVLNLIVSSLGYSNSNNIDVEVLYKSDDYIIVNKPEDVFINNNDKNVSSAHHYQVLYHILHSIEFDIQRIDETVFLLFFRDRL